MRQLKDLVAPAVPLASVYIGRLDRPSVFDEPAGATQVRIVKSLVDDGADVTTVNTVTTSIGRLPDFTSGYALFACQGKVLAAQRLPGGPLADLARYGAPARVGPMLAWLQRHPAYVLVEPNLAGAELTAVPAGGLRGLQRDVAGVDAYTPVTRSGLSWRPPRPIPWIHHVPSVAAAIAEELNRVAARLVLVAGDVRATHLLTEGLRDAGRAAVVRFLPARRAKEGFTGHLDIALANALDAYATSRTADLLTWLRRARGTPAAVEGTGPTLHALATATAHTLLIVDETADTRQAWFGIDHPCWIANGASRHPGELCQGRLVDAAIRAALLSGAAVRILAPSAAPEIGDGMAAMTTMAFRNLA